MPRSYLQCLMCIIRRAVEHHFMVINETPSNFDILAKLTHSIQELLEEWLYW